MRGVGSRDMLAGFGANSVWASISTVMSTVPLGTCGCTRLFFSRIKHNASCVILGVVYVFRRVKTVCTGSVVKPNIALELTCLFYDTLARSPAVQRASGILDAHWGSASSIAWQHEGSTDERKSISADSIRSSGLKGNS